MVHRKNFLTVKFRSILFFFLFGAFGPEQPSCHIECAPPVQLLAVKWIFFFISFFCRRLDCCVSLCDFSMSSFRIVVVDVTVDCGIECDAFAASIYRSILIYTTGHGFYESLYGTSVHCTNENCSGFGFYFFSYQFLIFLQKGRRHCRC